MEQKLACAARPKLRLEQKLVCDARTKLGAVSSPAVPPVGAAVIDKTKCAGGGVTATLEDIALKQLIEMDYLQNTSKYWII